MDIETVSQALYNILDALAEKEAAHKKVKDDLQGKADKLEFAIQQFMKQNNLEKVSTKRATFTMGMKQFVNIIDWDAFTQFVHQRNDFEFVKKGIKKTEALAYLEKEGSLPPGLTMIQEISLSKRRK